MTCREGGGSYLTHAPIGCLRAVWGGHRDQTGSGWEVAREMLFLPSDVWQFTINAICCLDNLFFVARNISSRRRHDNVVVMERTLGDTFHFVFEWVCGV